MIGVLLFATFGILILIGIPIGVSLGVSTVVAILLMPGLNLDFFVRGLITGLDSFPLIAALLFTIAGNIMGRGGISQRLLRLAEYFFGRMTGGMGVISIVACMMFAAISGTGSATVAAIGSIMIPTMMARGYDKNFAGSLVASAGTIGAMIPPSVLMIIYALASGASVTAMFVAGVVPGILVGLVLIAYCYYVSKQHGYRGKADDDDRLKGGGTKFKEILDTFWAISVPILILGGIYSGIFTPTEAAGVAVVYGTIVSAFIYREIRLRDLPAIFLESSLLVACVLIILGSSSGFGRVLALERVPTSIANFITGITTNKILILLCVNVLLLIVGTFMESAAAIIILTPILLPVVTSIGIGTVHFGMIMIVNLCIGFVTPPLGANLFMTAQVGRLKFDDLARAIVPWIVVMIFALLIITYVPPVSTGLGSLLEALK